MDLIRPSLFFKHRYAAWVAALSFHYRYPYYKPFGTSSAGNIQGVNGRRRALLFLHIGEKWLDINSFDS